MISHIPLPARSSIFLPHQSSCFRIGSSHMCHARQPRSCIRLHRLCKGFAPVGTFLLPSFSPNGEGAMAIGTGAMAMNAEVRAASTDNMEVDPRSEEWTRTAMRSQDASSPPGAGLSRRREQVTIASNAMLPLSVQLVHRWCRLETSRRP
jgi:hypothetical protein